MFYQGIDCFPLSWGPVVLNLLGFPPLGSQLSYSNLLFPKLVAMFSQFVSSYTRAIFTHPGTSLGNYQMSALLLLIWCFPSAPVQNDPFHLFSCRWIRGKAVELIKFHDVLHHTLVSLLQAQKFSSLCPLSICRVMFYIPQLLESFPSYRGFIPS